MYLTAFRAACSTVSVRTAEGHSDVTLHSRQETVRSFDWQRRIRAPPDKSTAGQKHRRIRASSDKSIVGQEHRRTRAPPDKSTAGQEHRRTRAPPDKSTVGQEHRRTKAPQQLHPEVSSQRQSFYPFYVLFHLHRSLCCRRFHKANVKGDI